MTDSEMKLGDGTWSKFPGCHRCQGWAIRKLQDQFAQSREELWRHACSPIRTARRNVITLEASLCHRAKWFRHRKLAAVQVAMGEKELHHHLVISPFTNAEVSLLKRRSFQDSIRDCCLRGTSVPEKTLPEWPATSQSSTSLPLAGTTPFPTPKSSPNLLPSTNSGLQS